MAALFRANGKTSHRNRYRRLQLQSRPPKARTVPGRKRGSPGSSALASHPLPAAPVLSPRDAMPNRETLAAATAAAAAFVM